MPLSKEQLSEMAKVLKVVNPNVISKLRKRVKGAIDDYHRNRKSHTPKELHKTFDSLNIMYRDFYDALNRLGETERKILDDAGSDVNEILSSYKNIGMSIRQAKRSLPPIKRGRLENSAGWLLVNRLEIIYSQSKVYIDIKGKEKFPIPKRRHDPVTQKDYGPFKDFVVLVFKAENIPIKGIDDQIRKALKLYGNKSKKKI